MHLPWRPPSRLLAWSFAGLALACSSVDHESDSEHVSDLISKGRYEEAVRYTDAQARKRPKDKGASELHRQASIAWLLENGRRQTFEDDDVEALESFRRAQELDPDSEIVAAWVEKTDRKLAQTWYRRGLELHAEDDLAGAIEAYEKALEYEPGDPGALSGMGQAVIQINHRQGLSEEYYNEGMSALGEYWLQQARSRFAYSRKYDAESERTARRLGQVDELLSDERVAVARTLEQEMRFGAARNEYRLALALNPKSAAAEDGLTRTKVEAKASAILDEARMAILRGDFEAADERLEAGLEMTVHQKALFEGARAEILEARLGAMYENALNLEKDFLYPEAVVAFGEILARADYFRDVLTRKETLEEYIRRAAELYAQAEAVSGKERLELLRQIEVFWPEYRDTADQIRELEREP